MANKRPETIADIQHRMEWWRKEAQALTSSSRHIEIRSGSLLTRLLDTIEAHNCISPSMAEAFNSGDGSYRP